MADQWMRGAGTDALQGDEADGASKIASNATAYLQDPLDRCLHGYINGCKVAYASASTVTVGVGACIAANSTGLIHQMRRNTSAVTVDITTDLDTGSEAVSTRYYVWAIQDADTTTFTCKMSLSATFPTGVTYSVLLGELYNNAAGDIEQVKSSWSRESIGILTGTVAHAGTIPLPDGFTEAQCKWFVSINALVASQDQHATRAENLSCSADGTRVVTISELGGNGIIAANGTANYFIIGIK